VLEYLLAVTLATWALWIIDPVSRLGRYHMLESCSITPGQDSGLGYRWVPGRFFCTSAILIGVLTVMMRNEPRHLCRGCFPPRLPAMLTYLGEVIFMDGHRASWR